MNNKINYMMDFFKLDIKEFIIRQNFNDNENILYY